MSGFKQIFFMFTFFAAAILGLGGCVPKLEKPLQICAGVESVQASLSALRRGRASAVAFRAYGQCRSQFYAEDKSYKENFPVRVWVNPPSQIRLHGDILFNARGIDLGSNEDEFWLAIKPKEISSYQWGRWDAQNTFGRLLINPRTLLEALGIVEVVGEGNWSLSNDGAFDVLTKIDAGAVTKRIYVYSCDYRISKIEYLDADGTVVVIAELSNYKEVSKNFFVPRVIKISSCNKGRAEDSFKITLKSVKPMDFTEKQDVYFSRPKLKGFKNVFRVIDGQIVEE